MLKQIERPHVGDPMAKLVTSAGDIVIRLFPEAAPKAVENFKGLIEKGYYDGVIFHRVIPDFMIQGGDPTGTGRGGESIWGSAFQDEFHKDYRNIVGALSMANAGPNTNGSQFFIVHGPTVEADIIGQMEDAGERYGYSSDVIDAYKEKGGAFWLDGKHTVFGQVYDGMDVVDAIANADRNAMDKPDEDIVIESAEVFAFEE
ncbi:MAG: peptidylprolyl isomerase [Peptoniphilus sp.]|nr:peptidylprolyl isomerase [Peptoniphilus sp.]MDD7362819.1 peptidylprolyl isomerase [Bacillota bacterium]MDY6043989.1 peptidylprolyl isomerase [Peptoniphilus sp.]